MKIKVWNCQNRKPLEDQQQQVLTKVCVCGSCEDSRGPSKSSFTVPLGFSIPWKKKSDQFSSREIAVLLASAMLADKKKSPHLKPFRPLCLTNKRAVLHPVTPFARLLNTSSLASSYLNAKKCFALSPKWHCICSLAVANLFLGKPFSHFYTDLYAIKV